MTEPGADPFQWRPFFTDSDGIKIDVMLFQTDGHLSVLDFVVYGEKQQRHPTPDELWLWDRTHGEEPPWPG